jgi:glutathione S-transferase
MLVLTALPYSPWSEKARWALDHHRMVYHSETYTPILGELKLRLRMRVLSGRVSVPVLYDGQTWLTDSFDIARYAERHGSGAPLFPKGKLNEIIAWNARSEAALAAGRALLMNEIEKQPERALAFLPPGVPAALKPHLLSVAQKGLQAFIAKYRMRDTEGQHEGVLLSELDRLAKALSGRRYLIGDSLSYADIVMAMVVIAIRPVDERYLARLPGTDG